MTICDSSHVSIDGPDDSPSAFDSFGSAKVDTESGLAEALASIPREPLANLPTPISRVRADWHSGALYVKRDDLTGMALSGNKVRKLEYLIADARLRGADTLVTWGSVRSNCARALAVAAASTGFRCVLVLACNEPPRDEGNLLIDRLVGAEIRLIEGADLERAKLAAEWEVHELRARGARPYVVPFGGSSLTGVLGYVRAAQELSAQLGNDSPIRTLIVPVASGGTYVGLALGLRMLQLPIRPVGAVVLDPPQAWVSRMIWMARETAKRFGLNTTLTADDINLFDARGDGYGKSTTDEVRFAIDFARQTGLLLDPVYTGKALFYWREGLREGFRDSVGRPELIGDPLFIHTGGTLDIFGQADLYRQILQRQFAGGPASFDYEHGGNPAHGLERQMTRLRCVNTS